MRKSPESEMTLGNANSSDLSGDAMLAIIRSLIDRIRMEGSCDPWIADEIGSLHLCDLEVFGRCVSFDFEVSFDADVLGNTLIPNYWH